MTGDHLLVNGEWLGEICHRKISNEPDEPLFEFHLQYSTCVLLIDKYGRCIVSECTEFRGKSVVESVRLCSLTTRGQVRRLLSVLGVSNSGEVK